MVTTANGEAAARLGFWTLAELDAFIPAALADRLNSRALRCKFFRSVSLLCGSERIRRMSWSRSRVQHCANALAFLGIAMGGIFLICEAGLRMYVTYNMDNLEDSRALRLIAPPELVQRAEFRGKLKQRRSAGYREVMTPGYRRGDNLHNSLGFRGLEIAMPKPQGEFRIACLGGSTTYDDGVGDWKKAYPAVLEAILRQRGYNVTVINAGTSGFTSRDSLVRLETAVAHLDVDMIEIGRASCRERV